MAEALQNAVPEGGVKASDPVSAEKQIPSSQRESASADIEFDPTTLDIPNAVSGES